MRVPSPQHLRKPHVFLLTLALLISSCTKEPAQAQTTSTLIPPHTTLILFADKPLSNERWGTLSATLQKETDLASAEAPTLASGADFLRGDLMPTGLELTNPISVYLHGDCTLLSVPQTKPNGALGWVRRVHGQIQPFIHIDCTKIAQELGPISLGMDRDRRNVVMSEAITRVILHEWIHIATQNAGHAKSGVTKSWFGIADLLAEDDETRINPLLLRPTKRL